MISIVSPRKNLQGLRTNPVALKCNKRQGWLERERESVCATLIHTSSLKANVYERRLRLLLNEKDASESSLSEALGEASKVRLQSIRSCTCLGSTFSCSCSSRSGWNRLVSSTRHVFSVRGWKHGTNVHKLQKGS